MSKDLVHWQQLPLAIPEADNVMIYSGGCVVDYHNASGFAKTPGQVPMVAIYTGHRTEDSTKKDDHIEAQYLAYSLDKGRTWTKYSGNPVLDLHQKDFRDPNVFWYEPTKSWIMALALPKEYKTQFYGSQNLKDWKLLSEFGPAGDTSFIWECPALVEVPVKDQAGKKKWILFNSVQYAMQYFVGEFDGKHFTAKTAQQRFSDLMKVLTFTLQSLTIIAFRRFSCLLGWANSWRYGNPFHLAMEKCYGITPKPFR